MFQSGVLAATAMPHIQGLDNAPVIPIADIPTHSDYSKEEVQLRNQLASLYRLVDKFHWSQAIFNHMTVRIHNDEGQEEILINPFGFSYHEVTASSLVKVDLKGNIIDQGSTNNPINQAGYVLHSTIHKGRPDIQAVLHLHTPSVAAVSSMKCGLLPCCQEAMILGPVAYHEYQGIVVDDGDEERASLVSDLGDKNIMILRNHGFVVVGKTIQEAFIMMYHLILACETQVRALSCGGVSELHIPMKDAVYRAYCIANNGAGGVNREKNGCVRNDRWKIGELEWQAWMRSLDSLGLRTGYNYRTI